MSQPFHLKSFEDEAREIVTSARSKARDLLAAAIAEAEKIREQARREGYAAGETAGRAKAEEAERARIAQSTSGLSALLEGIAQSLEVKRAELLANAERDLVGLAVSIAERIVRAEVAAGKPVVQESVRRAVELLVSRNQLEIRVNPKDLATVEAFVPQLKTRFGASKIDLAADESVESGGSVVRAAQGTVDADLKTQLEEISRALLG